VLHPCSAPRATAWPRDCTPWRRGLGVPLDERGCDGVPGLGGIAVTTNRTNSDTGRQRYAGHALEPPVRVRQRCPAGRGEAKRGGNNQALPDR
jgi:hypothetical protein